MSQSFQTTVMVDGEEYAIGVLFSYPAGYEAGISIQIEEVTGPNEVDVDPEVFQSTIERHHPQILEDIEAECKAQRQADEADSFDRYRKEDMR